MRRRAIYTCLALIALVGLAIPAGAFAKKKSKRPSITRVTPMRLPVGGKLTIRGKRFSSKRRRNTVIFLGPGRRTAFAKPKRVSSHKLVVIVPAAAGRLLGSRRTARYRLRVIVRRRNSRWTPRRLSPVVLSSRARDDETGTPSSACESGDSDGDLLPGSTELSIGTDPCLADRDGDGVQHGYEFQSAKDLNNDEDQQPNTSLHYPGKRPNPNPLDPSDAAIDFDGDSLTLAEEQRLWRFSDAAPRTLTPLSYSDGEQYSIYR